MSISYDDERLVGTLFYGFLKQFITIYLFYLFFHPYPFYFLGNPNLFSIGKVEITMVDLRRRYVMKIKN